MDRNISRDNLARHGIHYDANVYRANDANIPSTAQALPDHIDAVREGLLSMQKILPDDCDATLRKERVEYGSVQIGPG